MRDRHLRLVMPHCKKIGKRSFFNCCLKNLKEKIDCIFVSNNEKIYMIKNALIHIYKDYEYTTGIIDIPYFVRAEERIYRIIKDKKIDYYYCRLKKFKNKLN